MDEAIEMKEVHTDAITVEVARSEDAEVLAEILSSGVKNKLAHGDGSWGTEPYTAEELRERIKKGHTYIAKAGGEPVGTLLLIWEDELMWGDQPPVAAYVHQLAVKDGYRGKDLGKQLLDWASQQASNNGRDLLRVDFSAENEGLKSYYEDLGFSWVQDREVNAPHETYVAALYERPTES